MLVLTDLLTDLLTLLLLMGVSGGDIGVHTARVKRDMGTDSISVTN
jgi:hypothetical protein